MSHTNIHPVEVEVEGPAGLPVGPQPAVRMEDVPGKPGTLLGLVFRCTQFVCAVITVAVMASTDLTPVLVSGFLAAAAALTCLWSFPLAIVDLHALLVGRRLHNPRLIWFLTIGDAITGALLFTAACMAGGLSRFMCEPSDCVRITTSTIFAYLCLAVVSLSFFLNFSSLA